LEGLGTHRQGAQLGPLPNGGGETHDGHTAVHGALVDLKDVGWDESDPLRNVEHALFEFRSRIRTGCETGARRFLSADRIARQHELHPESRAEEPCMPLHVGSPESDGRITDLCVVGDINEIATRGELRRAGKTVTMDLGDDGLGEIPNAHPRLRHLTRVAAETISRLVRRRLVVDGASGEVVPGGEALACPTNNRDPRSVIGVMFAKSGDDLATHRGAKGIPLVRVVERDPADTRRWFINENLLVLHMSPRTFEPEASSGVMMARNRFDRIVRPIASIDWLHDPSTVNGTVRVESDASGAIRMVKTGVGPAAASVRSEAAILNRVRGPGVVAIVASSEISDGFEFSTAWIGYRSLSDIRRPTSVNRAAGFCLAIGATLQRVHAAGVAHNRVDPTRVLLDESGRPTICGFRSASIDSHRFGRDVAALADLTLWFLVASGPQAASRIGSRSDRPWRRQRLLTYLRSLADRSDEQMPPLEEILETLRNLVPDATLGLGTDADIDADIDAETEAEADAETVPEQTVTLERATKPDRSRRRRWVALVAACMTIIGGYATFGNRLEPESAALVALEIIAPPEAPIVSFGVNRYRIGRSGDIAVPLAPDCKDQMIIYLLRPETGTLFVFDSFATLGVDTYPTTRTPVTGVAAIEADIDPFTGCDALAITFADGRRKHFTQPETP
jgi:serine/threonine protein kinase